GFGHNEVIPNSVRAAFLDEMSEPAAGAKEQLALRKSSGSVQLEVTRGPGVLSEREGLADRKITRGLHDRACGVQTNCQVGRGAQPRRHRSCATIIDECRILRTWSAVGPVCCGQPITLCAGPGGLDWAIRVVLDYRNHI